MTIVLFVAAALMNAALAVASPVSTIAAADQVGGALAAAPNTAAVLGTGAGAILLTRARRRWAWRTTLASGYAAAAAGGLLAVPAVRGGDAVALCAAMLLIGFGNAAALLSRYAAAEHHPVGRRGFAIGVVVWAGALGAVGGPLLLGWLPRTGPFLFAAVAAAVAAGATLALPRVRPVEAPSRVPLRVLAYTPAARWALAVMATAQVVMAGIMTAAPLGMHRHHATLGTVGVALSAHALGMFALSPVTGWLLDRFGPRPVMLAGLLTMLLATAQLTLDEGLRVAALFQLGYGWNLCFVGGSGSLAGGLPAADRSGVEGAVDAAVWGLAAAAALGSTAAFAAGGYTLLGAVAAALLLAVALPLRSTMIREARTG